MENLGYCTINCWIFADRNFIRKTAPTMADSVPDPNPDHFWSFWRILSLIRIRLDGLKKKIKRIRIQAYT